MFKSIGKMLEIAKKKDPAARSKFFILLFYPGVHALMYYKIAHWFYKKRLFYISELISKRGRFKTGIEIHPGAVLDSSVFIDHGAGVVIGQTAVVEEGTVIYHGVTLGANKSIVEGRRHPIVKRNVVVGCGATILGAITIGENSKIAAGAVVLKDVPKNSVVAGIPARIVKENTYMEG